MKTNILRDPLSCMLRFFDKRTLMTAALTTIVFSAASAPAAQIGIKFAINGNGNSQSAAAGALQPTDVAGAPGYAQANWNVVGRYGDSSAAPAYGILDSAGNVSGLIVNWDASGNYSQQGGGTPTAQGTPDGNLMNGFLDSGGAPNSVLVNTVFGNSSSNKPLVYVSGIASWLTNQGGATYYDVVIYMDGDQNQARCGEYWLMNASGPTSGLTYNGDLTTHIFVADRYNFISDLTYRQTPSSVQNGRVAQMGNFPGNYIVFTSLTNDSFLLRTSEFVSGGTLRSPINAIQIVPRLTPVPPTIYPVPPAKVYAGAKASFQASVAGMTPMTLQWQKDGTNLVTTPSILSVTNSTLTIANVGAGDVGNYTLIASNAIGVSTSSAAGLTIVTPVSGSYEELIATNNPYAYWRFNELGDPSTNYSPALDYVGGLTGIYDNAAQNSFNGVVGPQPTDWPGFEANNAGFRPNNNTARSWIVAPPLALNTNAMSVVAWIYPTVAQAGFTGLLSSRAATGSDVFVFGYGNNNNLGYTWTNAANSYNFVSGLVPLTNAWSLVALTVSPSNAILYCYNTNGQFSATNNLLTTHLVEAFSGITMIGDDPGGSLTTPEGRAFTGTIDEMTVFKRTLTQLEIYNLYKKGLGLTAIGPVVSTQPQSQGLFEGRNATFTITASGDAPLSYQWRKNGVNLSNGGNISGATTPSLTVSNVTIANDAANYDIVVGNIVGSVTSSVANLMVVVSNSTPGAYEAKLRSLNPISYWRLNETNGSPVSYDYWGGNIAADISDTLGVAGPVSPPFIGLETTNTGAQFDGLSSYIDSGASIMNNRSAFSIVGWFNTAGTIGTRIGLFGQNDVAEFGFHGTNGVGVAQLGLYTIAGTALMDQSNITAGVWYMIAGEATGTNVSIILLGTNGGGGFSVVQSSVAGVATNYGNSAYPFRIGGGGVLDPTGNFFTGSIDEVAVFNRALSVSELSDLFGAALTGGALAPGISSQSGSLSLYAGRTANFSVTTVGTSPQYQWRSNGVPVSDGGNLFGSSTSTLTITNVSAANMANYDCVVTNVAGSVTSVVASLTIVTPVPGTYESAVIAASPIAYYRLNETNDPSTGTAVAHDYFGGNNGLYTSTVLNGFNGVLGPLPPVFTFETNNAAISVASNSVVGAGSWVTAPFGSLSTNTVTMTMWIQPTGGFNAFAGLLMNRNSGVAGGFGYANGQLGYTWNNNNQNTWGYQSGIVPPLFQWSFVALVIQPTQAILYMINPSGVFSATNVVAHTSDVFGNLWEIGNDNIDNNTDGAREFTGMIDEVAVFNYSMTASQLLSLYGAGGPVPVTLNIQPSGGNVVVTWGQGTLLEANDVSGPWVTNNATSPYTVTPSAASKFYRVRVR